MEALKATPDFRRRAAGGVIGGHEWATPPLIARVVVNQL